MDFYLDVSEKEYNNIKDLDTSLGMALWNIAVMNAPIDTGNLRRAISLASNNSKNIRVQYNLLTANYIHFLENAYGPVKKYKGFISNRTVGAFIQEIISFIKKGTISSFVLGLPPIVATAKTKSVFGQERKIMNNIGMTQKNLTANQRKKISALRERSYQASIGEKAGGSRGQKVITKNRASLTKTFRIVGSRN